MASLHLSVTTSSCRTRVSAKNVTGVDRHAPVRILQYPGATKSRASPALWAREQASVRRRVLVTRASVEAPAAPAETAVDAAIEVLSEASDTRSIPGARVFWALRQLEKAKLEPEDLNNLLGGRKGGTRWQLVFTSGTKEVQKALKGGKGNGQYFPLTGVQSWDASTGKITNGIYLGQLAALRFAGPYSVKGKRLSFDFSEIGIRLGPKWFSFQLKPGQLGTKKSEDDKGGPFFTFFYVDDHVAAARGRGGGVALWKRTTPEWDLQAGIDL